MTLLGGLAVLFTVAVAMYLALPRFTTWIFGKATGKRVQKALWWVVRGLPGAVLIFVGHLILWAGKLFWGR